MKLCQIMGVLVELRELCERSKEEELQNPFNCQQIVTQASPAQASLVLDQEPDGTPLKNMRQATNSAGKCIEDVCNNEDVSEKVDY